MAEASYRISAHNYAFDSENKIHSDDVAEKYGFQGGLVPGVADFAYLLRAAYLVFGDGWLHQGSIEAKFLKPVYHGDAVIAVAHTKGDDERTLTLALKNSDGIVCAAGEAWADVSESAPEIDDFPYLTPPALAARPFPTVTAFPAGTALGSYEYDFVQGEAHDTSTQRFAAPFLDSKGQPLWQPSNCLHDANRCLRASVALGPWIHTGSRLQLYGSPRDGDRISLRGRVTDTFTKKGHTRTELELAWFANELGVARIRHAAIIALAGVS
jgi:hypothetical protein